MIKDYSAQKTYIPKAGGNRELPPEEQMKITYPAVSRATRMTIMPRMKYKAKADADGNPDGYEGELQISERALITGMKPKFHTFGYREESTAEVKMIRNAEDLFNAPDEVVRDLIEELVTHFRQELKEVPDEKN